MARGRRGGRRRGASVRRDPESMRLREALFGDGPRPAARSAVMHRVDNGAWVSVMSDGKEVDGFFVTLPDGVSDDPCADAEDEARMLARDHGAESFAVADDDGPAVGWDAVRGARRGGGRRRAGRRPRRPAPVGDGPHAVSSPVVRPAQLFLDPFSPEDGVGMTDGVDSSGDILVLDDLAGMLTSSPA